MADAEAFERAILNHITRIPADEHGEGKLYVKVVFEPQEPEDDAIHGGVFLSMPRFAADPDWMRKVMQHVRDGFERGDIDVPFRVTLREPEDLYSHTDDEVGGVLLTLPATFTAEPRT